MDPIDELRKLQREADGFGQKSYDSREARLLRLEVIVDVLARALLIKADFDLSETRRMLGELPPDSGSHHQPNTGKVKFK